MCQLNKVQLETQTLLLLENTDIVMGGWLIG